MKKTITIVSVVAALFVTLLVAAIIVACTNRTVNISRVEGAKAVSVAAENYQKYHKDYDNFANLALTIHYDVDSTNQEELTCRRTKSAALTTSEYTNTTKVTGDLTIAIKNVGENLYLSVESVAVEKSKNYSVDANQVLNINKVDRTTTQKYTLTVQTVDNEVSYFITSYEKVTEDEDDVITKQYYEFPNRTSYVSAVNAYLNYINQTVEGFYFLAFSSAENLQTFAPYINYTKKKDTVEWTSETVEPIVSNGTTSTSTTKCKASFKGKDIDAASAELVQKANSGLDSKIVWKVNARTNVENIMMPSLVGYTKATQAIEIGDILGNLGN